VASAAQFRTVGLRPERHIWQHRRIQAADRGFHTTLIRQVSLASQGVRNNADITERLTLPKAFVIAEQEQLIFFDRPSHRGSELVLLEWRDGTLIKVVATIQRAVSDKLVKRPMQRIAPRLRDHADLSPLA